MAKSRTYELTVTITATVMVVTANGEEAASNMAKGYLEVISTNPNISVDHSEVDDAELQEEYENDE